MENSAVKINELENTTKGYKEIVESSANTASTKADIALDKVDIATEKAGIATEKATEISTALSTKANKDMDNLSNIWKENVAHLAMPSSSYVDLSFISNSVSSSGYTYIAPGTGYFSFNFVTAGSGSGSSVVLYRNDKPYELLSDNTIGQSTPATETAQKLGLKLMTKKEIVYAWNGKRYFIR